MKSPEPPPVATDQAPDPFAGSPYRTIRSIGQGGMGEVFEVEHVALSKRVVAKLLKVQFLNDANILERFRFEAQALAQLAHPNLVAVLDLGRTTDGRPYFVMERLCGRTLGDELRARRTLPVAEAIELCCQVLAGLGAAHAHGLVHRDVKLDNVFVCDAPSSADGARTTPSTRLVKVLDFGVAKTRRSGEQLAKAPAYPTAEGIVMGTPRYIAPEQIRGVAVDARADLYAAGVLLYALIAGRAPFTQPGALAILQAHLSELPKPPSHWTTAPVPAELDAAILRALTKRPEDRFESAAAFASELRRIAERVQAEETRPLPAGSRPEIAAPVVLSVAPQGTVRMLAAPGLQGSGDAARKLFSPIQCPEPPADPRGPRRRNVWAVAAVFFGSALGFWLLFGTVMRLVGWP